MLKRKLFLIAVTLLVGCSDITDPVGDPPRARTQDQRERTTDEGESEPGEGIDKCRIYSLPEICPFRY